MAADARGAGPPDLPDLIGPLERALALQPDNPGLTALLGRLHLLSSGSPGDAHARRAEELAGVLSASAELDPVGPVLAEEVAFARGDVMGAMAYGEEAATRIFAALAEAWAASAASDVDLDAAPRAPGPASPPPRRASWKLTTTDWRTVKQLSRVWVPVAAVAIVVDLLRGCSR